MDAPVRGETLVVNHLRQVVRFFRRYSCLLNAFMTVSLGQDTDTSAIEIGDRGRTAPVPPCRHGSDGQESGALMRRIAAIVTGLVLLIVLAWLLFGSHGPQAGEVKDEAMLAGRKAASFPPSADGTLFRDMDNGITLSDDENRGRNMW